MSQFAEFAELLSQQMQRVCKARSETVLEFGTIRNDLSLRLDGLKDDIPIGEYLVGLHLFALTGDYLRSVTESNHNHVLPDPLRGLKPGDRVLAAWVGGQPIVVDIIVNSKELTLYGR